MYGYEMVEALSRRTDGILTIGRSTLYPLLYNLERKRLISGVWREAGSGRRRKYYRLTKKGSAWLAKQQAQWDSLVQAMGRIGMGDVGAEGK